MSRSIVKLIAPVAAALVALAVTSQRASAQWTGSLSSSNPPCPQVGDADGCNVLFTIGPTGTVIQTNPVPGNYDGSEDVLVGIINNWTGHTITGITLSGTNIFLDDGDGACSNPASLPWPNGGGTYGGPPSNCTGTGYPGPNTTFAITNNDNGTVNFTSPLGDGGGSAWWSLEEPPAGSGGITVGTLEEAVVPEPATMSLLGLGLVSLAGMRRRKIKK